MEEPKMFEEYLNDNADERNTSQKFNYAMQDMLNDHAKQIKLLQEQVEELKSNQ